MPYRRLPNTNKARLRALKKVVEKGRSLPFLDIPFSADLLREANNEYHQFESALSYYNQCLSNQSSANRKHQVNVKNARLYVSHFIQVLNLCVIRDEIKTSAKRLYHLPEDTHNLPDLSSESLLLEWGRKIIEGEEKRLIEGGIPIYNPTIAKVKVLFDIFEEGYWAQKNLQRITQQSLTTLNDKIETVDALILKLWNAIEDKYQMLPQEKRISICQSFGVVYYYRKKKKVNMN